MDALQDTVSRMIVMISTGEWIRCNMLFVNAAQLKTVCENSRGLLATQMSDPGSQGSKGTSSRLCPMNAAAPNHSARLEQADLF
jgi:hypothetical protein